MSKRERESSLYSEPTGREQDVNVVPVGQFGRRNAPGHKIGLSISQLKGLGKLAPADLPIEKDVFDDLIQFEIDRRFFAELDSKELDVLARENKKPFTNRVTSNRFDDNVLLDRQAKYIATIENLEEAYDMDDPAGELISQQNVDALERILIDTLSKVSEENNRVAIRGLTDISKQNVRTVCSPELTAV